MECSAAWNPSRRHDIQSRSGSTSIFKLGGYILSGHCTSPCPVFSRCTSCTFQERHVNVDTWVCTKSLSRRGLWRTVCILVKFQLSLVRNLKANYRIPDNKAEAIRYL